MESVPLVLGNLISEYVVTEVKDVSRVDLNELMPTKKSNFPFSYRRLILQIEYFYSYSVRFVNCVIEHVCSHPTHFYKNVTVPLSIISAARFAWASAVKTGVIRPRD